ncbi:hypothetical protein FN846DRAFT_913928 [Sphaerosporella brunnea]|uniref:Uncharacterized protein n=1 Tax=Sphaerosporella brunnea TaxID=1250544 RepID=A0A5J5EFL3_9PEZI|nr:hypothetical protein FN846DRAFT_913928 [Sphaerosporella brunnea]
MNPNAAPPLEDPSDPIESSQVPVDKADDMEIDLQGVSRWSEPALTPLPTPTAVIATPTPVVYITAALTRKIEALEETLEKATIKTKASAPPRPAPIPIPIPTPAPLPPLPPTADTEMSGTWFDPPVDQFLKDTEEDAARRQRNPPANSVAGAITAAGKGNLKDFTHATTSVVAGPSKVTSIAKRKEKAPTPVQTKPAKTPAPRAAVKPNTFAAIVNNEGNTSRNDDSWTTVAMTKKPSKAVNAIPGLKPAGHEVLR